MKNQEESKPIPTYVAEHREAHVLPVKERYDAEPSEKHLKGYEKSLEEYQEFLWRCL